MQSDLNYYSRRAAEERRAGMTAASEKARACHFELAAAYERRVKDLQAKIRRSAIHIVTAA
jgi:hypothetical protein